MDRLEDVRIAMHADADGFGRVMASMKFASQTAAERERAVQDSWATLKEKGRG